MLLHLPEMNMMHIPDAIDINHRVDHCTCIHVRRATQHQHTDRAADFSECQIEDIKRDTDGDRGISPEQILTTALPIFATSTILLTLLSQTDSLLVFVVPLWVSIGLVGLLSANAMSLAMEWTKAAAGMGSALLGAIQFALAFAVSSFVAVGGASTALPMALGLAIPASAASLLYFVTRRFSESENLNGEL